MNLFKSPIVILVLAGFAVVTRGQVTGKAAQPSPITNMKTDSATFIDSNTVAAAFAKGGPLIENSQFKIQAGRRDAPGIVEIHLRDTDIFHILEGSAPFVTRGTPSDRKTIAQAELRGTELPGGARH